VTRLWWPQSSSLPGAKPFGARSWLGSDGATSPTQSLQCSSSTRGSAGQKCFPCPGQASGQRPLGGVMAVGPPAPGETPLPRGASSSCSKPWAELLQPLRFVAPCKSCFQASTRRRQLSQARGHPLCTPKLGFSSVSPHMGVPPAGPAPPWQALASGDLDSPQQPPAGSSGITTFSSCSG